MMNRAILKHILPLFVLGSLLAGPRGLQAQEEFGPVATHILEQLQKMEYTYPQQKAYLHLDKKEYLAGENIWMKVYLVNAATHRPDTLTTNLYVELINSQGELASVNLLRMRDGFSHGDIRLPDSITEGNYRLRAYTDWMHNFGEEHFFTTDIYVYSPIEENFIRRRDVWQNRQFNRRLERRQEKMQFAFFPEGGELVEGMENRVAFKAANALGAGVEASGEVTDQDGNTVASISTIHNGMGYFRFTPEAGRRYRASIEFAGGERERIGLPAASGRAHLLSARQTEQSIEVKVSRNFRAEDQRAYILAQTRGRAYFMEEALLEDGVFRTSINKELLPTGVTQIVLFDGRGQPIAERLVFVHHGDIAGVDYLEYGIHVVDEQEEMHVAMALDNDEHQGSYSLAILDTHGEAVDYRSNIASELLLFSDLVHAAEDPWFYLSDNTGEPAMAADLLMMTHGWRRFDWEKILDDEFPEIRYGFPKGIVFAGKVSPRASDRATGEVDVELAVYQDEVNIYSTTTDRRGNFAFSNLDYTGDFTATLRVEQTLEKRSLRVDLASRDFDEIRYGKNFNTRPLRVTARGEDWQRVKKPQTVMRSRGLLEPSRETLSMYSQADQVIYFEDIRDQHSSIMDVLRTRVRGLRVVGGEIMLRGPSSFRFSNEPVFLIDEVIVDRSSFLNLSVHEVERMAVISGPQSAILGSRGANGALLIYTRRGDSHRHLSYEYLLKGFHEASETFESRIHTEQYVKSQLDRTLYWNYAVEVNDFGEIDARFPVDQHLRNVRVIIQGIDENGRITFHDQIINR